jgi:hypothetical protein
VVELLGAKAPVKGQQTGLTCALINDFEIPWYSISNKTIYPKYKRRIKIKKDLGSDQDDNSMESMSEREEEATESDPASGSDAGGS